jgi:NAD-dependent SIR2 family protein deacetylase
MDVENGTYKMLFSLVKDKDYFVLTTNVDHQFQKAGFDKHRLFYTQGDYGLFQCSEPCCQKTFDNEEIIRRMYSEQKNMRIPSELIPKCPECGKPITMNLRADDKFVQDKGWYMASQRYSDYLRRHEGMLILFLELGVGFNTPVIIKYPFWQMTAKNPNAVYACINFDEAFCPEELEKKSIGIGGDIAEVLRDMI